jgi:hypothetical protein
MRNALLEAIYARYTKNSGSNIANALGDNFFAGEAPQGCKTPHAVYWIVSDTPDGSFDEEDECSVSEYEWQVNCFSDDFTEAQNLADWCVALFSGQTLTNGAQDFSCSKESIFGPFRKDDQTPWETIATFFSV